jgi:hypothetical protein
MAQRNALLLFRQQLEESLEIVRVEFFGWRELPQDRPELVAERGDARTQETRHRLAGLTEHAAVGDETVAFQRIDKTVRRLVCPFDEGRLLETRIIGAVDLDAWHLPGCVVQLLRLGQLVRVERLVPWLEGPAAHAGADCSRLSHSRPPGLKWIRP